MDYRITIDKFEGPMDLLLHLIKKTDIDICEINISEIIEQYFDYIHQMEEMNLDIASEYLTMAAELLEIKSSLLLPKPVLEDSEYEEDPKEQLIRRLIEYKKYKESTEEFKALEEQRKLFYTKEPNDLSEFRNDSEEMDLGEIDLNDLIDAFSKFIERKKLEQPLNTKITKREYSVSERSLEIKNILKNKKKIDFEDLFEEFNKEYIVVTFLSILSMAKKQELVIKQENNFSNIILALKGSE